MVTIMDQANCEIMRGAILYLAVRDPEIKKRVDELRAAIAEDGSEHEIECKTTSLRNLNEEIINGLKP